MTSSQAVDEKLMILIFPGEFEWVVYLSLKNSKTCQSHSMFYKTTLLVKPHNSLPVVNLRVGPSNLLLQVQNGSWLAWSLRSKRHRLKIRLKISLKSYLVFLAFSIVKIACLQIFLKKLLFV